jgi:hypothetical protein
MWQRRNVCYKRSNVNYSVQKVLFTEVNQRSLDLLSSCQVGTFSHFKMGTLRVLHLGLLTICVMKG